MNISIINIGDELLIGQVVNTNASQMSQRLIAAGMDVLEVVTIADRAQAIDSSLRRLLLQSDAVLITGGLGPTKDDITKQVLSHFFDSPLVENPEALANVARLFKARGYELTPVNRQQAWVPQCCTMINNAVGTAPCMWFEIPDTRQVVVSMPGVPFEMEYLMDHEVLPRLKAHFHCDHILHKHLLVQGIGESFLSDLIEDWELHLPSSIRLAYLPQAGMVRLRLTARGTDRQQLERQIADAVSTLYPIAGPFIVGEDLQSLPELVAYHFQHYAKSLATAESCTGGRLAAQLTALSGASSYFKGGIVSYCNEVKADALGVSPDILASIGAVSEETARQMAEGVRQRLHADYGVATTGVAGPTGGTPENPVGTVWIAIASPQGTFAKRMKYGDRRAQTIERACNEAYSLLVKQIIQENKEVCDQRGANI